MIIAEGKTKKILKGPRENTVLLKTFDILTAGDAAKRESIEGIGINKTTQAKNVFTLLNKKGIPTAFIDAHSSDTILCHQCDMIPLEIVIRRYAFGSYLLRNPSYKTENGAPHRFDTPVVEFFHKWSLIASPASDKPYQTNEDNARKLYLRDSVWAKGVYTDPYILIKDGKWGLCPQKQELKDDSVLLAIDPVFTDAELENVKDIALRTFLVLEEAWSRINTKYGPVALVDLKIELGRRVSDGTIVVADVIDNDSWRIWPGADPTKQLDKQSFRDNDPLSKVAENYNVVTELTEQFVNL